MKVDLRKPTEDDLARFRQCLAADADHAGQDPNDWTAAPGEMMTFFDKRGNRVWVRIERVLRVSIQHDHETSEKSRPIMLYRIFFWLQGMARQAGFTEIIFESRAMRLIQFVKNLFGVTPVEENYHVYTRPTQTRSN